MFLQKWEQKQQPRNMLTFNLFKPWPQIGSYPNNDPIPMSMVGTIARGQGSTIGWGSLTMAEVPDLLCDDGEVPNNKPLADEDNECW